MALVVFPDTLPGPSMSRVVPGERRIPSDLSGGPQQFRGIQRDYSAVHEVEWSLLSPAEAAIFDDWWRLTLVKGGLWFSSTWPAPQGYGNLVRRFSEAPAWTLLEGGYWKVGAKLVVRGRTMPPVDCFVENFSASLGPYTLVSGHFAPFTVSAGTYGGTLWTHTSSTSNDNSAMIREIPSRTITSFSAKFSVGTANTDDANLVTLLDAGTIKFGFSPRREAFYDSQSRPAIYVGTSPTYMGSTALSLSVWYQLDVKIIPGVGNSTATIRRLSDDSIVSSVNLSGSLIPTLINQIQFRVDDADRVSESAYADIHLC